MRILAYFFFIGIFSTSSFSKQIIKSNDDRAIGEKLFKSKNCTMCHKKDSNNIGPSVSNIALVYSGKEKQLYRYLQSKSKPIVTPSKAHIMDGQFLKLKGFDNSKLKSIARYIITISDREF